MKKLSAFGLSIILLISMLTVSATAQSTYSYQPVTLTNQYGDCYSFSAACIGYGISYETDGGEYTSAAIILKNNSSVTVTQSSGGESYVVMGWNGGKYVTDWVGSGLEDGRANVEDMFHYYISFFGYDLEDSMAYFVTAQGQSVVLLTECAAQRHSDMLIYPGPEVNFGTPAEPITFQFGDNYYDSDIGPINDITFTNNTDERITGAFTLLIYNPEAFCNECLYECGEAHRDIIGAFLYPVDIDLAPGESMTETAFFGSKYNMTELKYVWVEYDDAAEREQYLNKAGSTPDATVEYGERYGYLAYWHLDAGYLAQYPYNITFAPVNHK